MCASTPLVSDPSLCHTRPVKHYCACAFTPGRLIHVTEQVTFYPQARLCRVKDTLYNARKFAWGMHTWDYLAGVTRDKPKIMTLTRRPHQTWHPAAYCLDVRFDASHRPEEYTHDSILVWDTIFTTYNFVLMGVYVRRIQRAMRRFLASKNLAVAMALHARLGRDSALQALCSDMLRKITLRGRNHS